MRIRPIIAGVAVFAIITSWNGLALLDSNKFGIAGRSTWQDSQQDVAKASLSNEPELWREIKKTSVEDTDDGGFKATFKDSVLAVDGKRVELPGVGFLINSGIQENQKGEKEVTEFLLLPGDGGVAWCCGLTPIPNFEFSILVECPDAPFLASIVDPGNPAIFVNIAGILQLEHENSIGALYTMKDVSIEFIDMKEVMPPNVLNLCLNKPMAP
ncbi:MAG: hypothetical protein AAF664_24090 [Planctomycetota bacterium]